MFSSSTRSREFHKHVFFVLSGLVTFVVTLCEYEGVICHQSKLHTVGIGYYLLVVFIGSEDYGDYCLS